jgi:hypothetical protein
MKHHHTSYFLFVRGFDNFFLRGGLGVEDQQNGTHEDLEPSRSDFNGVGPNRKSIEQNQKHLTNWHNNLETFCRLISVFSELQKYVQNAGFFIIIGH